jgi:hypothetical protein
MSILNKATNQTQASLISTLIENNEELISLNDDVKEILSSVKIFSYYETKSIRLSTELVCALWLKQPFCH